jgi:hypothetical protein
MTKWIVGIATLAVVLSAHAGPIDNPRRPPERRYKSPAANARVRLDYLLASLRPGMSLMEVDRAIRASGLNASLYGPPRDTGNVRYVFSDIATRRVVTFRFDEVRRLDSWRR